LQVGQRVYAIGNPFGLDHTITTGIVSGTRRQIASGNTGRPIEGVIQTDAAINPGNSGGPLLDSDGKVIGINTAIYSSSGTNSGVSFAVPIDAVENEVLEILDKGRVSKPVMGISLAPDALAEELARVDMQPEVLDLRAPKALAVQRPSIPPMLGAWAPYAGKIPAQIARLWNVV